MTQEHYIASTNYSASGAVDLNTVVVGPLDCTEFRGISIQCSSMGTSGVVTPEWSNNGTDWTAGPLASGSSGSVSTISAAGLYLTPVYGAWFRLRVSTAVTAGSTAIQVAQISDAVNGSGVTQPVSGTVTAVGLQVITTATFTRPSDTTAYAAQDVVSDSTSAPTILTFSSAARANGGSGMILSARHLKNSTTTTGATYRLHLYTSAPSAINDNSPFTLLYANRTIRIGFIDFSHTTGGSGSDSTNALTTFVNLPFVCDPASTSLFGILTVTSAYTPTSAEQHFIELQIARN